MHLPFFYCQVDSLLPPATTCSMCTWLGRVSPCHRRPSSQCQIPPLPETSESVWLLPATSPSHTALILWLFSWHLWQKMSSYKQILFSFALISLLADTFPVSPMLGFLSPPRDLAVSSWESPWPLRLCVPPVQGGCGRRRLGSRFQVRYQGFHCIVIYRVRNGEPQPPSP